MKTELKYLENTYLLQDEAKIISIGEDERGAYCLLNSTIFYPQGGGQATDIGEIKINGSVYHINFVASIDEDIRHYGDFKDENIVNKTANLHVDKNTRMLNAKSHTAGHLVSSILESMDNLIGVKGYHFLNGSYVEFEGTKPENIEEFIIEANESLKNTLSKNTSISTKIVTKKELETICKNVPDYIPSNKPIRVMKFEEFEPIPCGGTHLNTLKDLDTVIITKINSKKGKVKASYIFE